QCCSGAAADAVDDPDASLPELIKLAVAHHDVFWVERGTIVLYFDGDAACAANHQAVTDNNMLAAGDVEPLRAGTVPPVVRFEDADAVGDGEVGVLKRVDQLRHLVSNHTVNHAAMAAAEHGHDAR